MCISDKLKRGRQLALELRQEHLLAFAVNQALLLRRQYVRD